MKQFFAICIVIAGAMTVAFATKSFSYSNPAKDSIVEANIECLTDDEPTITGKCNPGVEECFFSCKKCGAQYYSNKNHDKEGEAYEVSGICLVCKKEL
ncbi:MAG: hypothetical protein PHD11_04915 [Bacteroidales bacterium]|nr:hypothetical protein [Bacteroidales bacterium]MDD4669545.1 hypothetical protein [Bacteroidales bacterium]